jgi:hypothetical protein
MEKEIHVPRLRYRFLPRIRVSLWGHTGIVLETFTYQEHPARYSLWAQVAILAITLLWSRTVDGVLFSGDAIAYFRMLSDGSWIDSYRLQPTMFLVLSIFRPATFQTYIAYSGAIPLTLLLISFYRKGYSRVDQFLLTLFFSCSFYGVHFLLDFQRQFYAIVFFVLATTMKRASLPARMASLLSHSFAFVTQLFWSARRLDIKMALLLCVPAIPLLYFLATLVDPERVASYSSGEQAFSSIIIKQLLNIGYTVIIILTLKKGQSSVRTLAYLYIGISLPCLLSVTYGRLFARFDYYFFPLLVAFWPTALDPKWRVLFRVVLIGSTVLGFYLWVHMNFSWIINSIG